MARSKLSLGCLFWIVLILLVIVIILANLKTADEIVKKTGFVEFIENLVSGKKERPDGTRPTTEPPLLVTRTPESGKTPIPEPTTVRGKTTAEPVAATAKPEATPHVTPLAESAPVRSDKPNLRNARLHFVRANDDGTTAVKSFARKVYYDDEPLKETILALLSGPTAEEGKDGFESLIPRGARLKNVYVKNRTAFIDFNEAFRFNQMGREGQILQITQIVYTATEFSNIDYVQFLVEGERIDFLGPEGIAIGKPISRDDCASL